MKAVHPFILCVDDDLDDLLMLQEAFAASGCTYAVKVASNGEEALQQLRNTSGALPCLIVLDVNMPRVDGRETLLALKADKQLNNIPVVAFSTSSSPMDKMFFNRHNVAFFTKPNYLHDLESLATAMLNHCRPEADVIRA